MEINPEILRQLAGLKKSTPRITVLTGAGISAESGIPTFRGPEGYWTIGSRVYQPQEIATRRMFRSKPLEVWKWYLYRVKVCSGAEPNPGHLALVELERQMPDRFKLITQNVDNLHLQAGSSRENTYQIHGNIFYARCLQECEGKIHPLPVDAELLPDGEVKPELPPELLTCPDCGDWLRPHVLWFDESYNEDYYHFESSLTAAAQTDLLLIVGTSGATNLPQQVAWQVFQNGGTIYDINIERNSFSDLAENSPGGAFLQGSAAVILPEMVKALC